MIAAALHRHLHSTLALFPWTSPVSFWFTAKVFWYGPKWKVSQELIVEQLCEALHSLFAKQKPTRPQLTRTKSPNGFQLHSKLPTWSRFLAAQRKIGAQFSQWVSEVYPGWQSSELSVFPAIPIDVLLEMQGWHKICLDLFGLCLDG